MRPCWQVFGLASMPGTPAPTPRFPTARRQCFVVEVVLALPLRGSPDDAWIGDRVPFSAGGTIAARHQHGYVTWLIRS